MYNNISINESSFEHAFDFIHGFWNEINNFILIWNCFKFSTLIDKFSQTFKLLIKYFELLHLSCKRIAEFVDIKLLSIKLFRKFTDYLVLSILHSSYDFFKWVFNDINLLSFELINVDLDHSNELELLMNLLLLSIKRIAYLLKLSFERWRELYELLKLMAIVIKEHALRANRNFTCIAVVFNFFLRMLWTWILNSGKGFWLVSLLLLSSFSRQRRRLWFRTYHALNFSSFLNGKLQAILAKSVTTLF